MARVVGVDSAGRTSEAASRNWIQVGGEAIVAAAWEDCGRREGWVRAHERAVADSRGGSDGLGNVFGLEEGSAR